MNKKYLAVIGFGILVLGGAASVLAFDNPVKPAPLASISDAFASVDFSDLPTVTRYVARDGAHLDYRSYEGGGSQVVVLIHGSSDDGAGIHPLARALRDAGASVYVPVMRGHGRGDSDRIGDIAYIGQLEDDVADLVNTLRPLHPNASFTLIGFSSGGGFVLRAVAGPDERIFDRFIMISPAFPQSAPTIRPATGGWVSVAVPRIIALKLLNRVGVTWFNGLPVVSFATSPRASNLTSVYSYRMAVDFGAPPDYLGALGRSKKPAALLIGGADELFFPDRFAPLIAEVRPDVRVTVVPGVGHIGMTVTPEGIAAVTEAFANLIASPKS